MATIRCHTVPQFYLNYFLTPGSNLFWIYHKKDAASRKQPPINTTVIGDYYLSEPDKEGKKDKRGEEFLSIIEGLGKAVLDKIISDPFHCDEKDKEAIAMFLAFTHCRSPRSIEAIKEIGEAQVNYLLDKLKERAKDPIEAKQMYERFAKSSNSSDAPISFEDFTKMVSNIQVEVNEKHSIGDSLLSAEKVHLRLMQMNWCICIAKKDNFFVTSDAPLIVFLPTGLIHFIFYGWLHIARIRAE